VRIAGEFDVHREALVEAILDLGADLVVGKIWQKRKAALMRIAVPLDRDQIRSLKVFI
jgi:hypothetical protein